jgi:hypothetical protein
MQKPNPLASADTELVQPKEASEENQEAREANQQPIHEQERSDKASHEGGAQDHQRRRVVTLPAQL